MNKKFKKGFTVIEVLITVGIVIIFASVAIVSLSQSKAKTRDAVRISDLKNLAYASDNYFTQNGKFPTDVSELGQYFASGIPNDPEGHPYAYRFYGNGYCFGAIMETSIPNPTPDTDPQCPTDIGANYVIKGP